MIDTTDIDNLITKHVDSCPRCIKGELCNLRDALFLQRAERKHGNVVAKNDHIKATIQYTKGQPPSLLLTIGGQFAGTLSQADGAELERGLQRLSFGDVL
jgi:hypothetical protein